MIKLEKYRADYIINGKGYWVLEGSQSKDLAGARHALAGLKQMGFYGELKLGKGGVGWPYGVLYNGYLTAKGEKYYRDEGII
jgi:hypothetical protein